MQITNRFSVRSHYQLQTKEEQQNCVLDCPTNKECVQQTCCGPRQLKEAKNGSKNTLVPVDAALDASQSLLPNDKKSNTKLDKLDNTVIEMIEQPGDKESKKSVKDDV